MERTPLKTLVKDAIEASGGLVDDLGESLEAVLPQEVALKAGLKEHQCFSFTAEGRRENDEFVSYDSPVLDSIARLVNDRGFFCKTGLDGIHLRRVNLQEVMSRKISLLNSVFKLEGRMERTISYLILNFKYSAISEEKKEGLVSTAVNEVTLSSSGDMLAALAGYSGNHQVKDQVVSRRPLEEVFKASYGIAEQYVTRSLEAFRNGMNRRLGRDIVRLQGYYGALKDEANARIEKRGLSGEEKERELGRIRAIELELARKSAEQAGRYSIHVDVQVINALRVYMPVLFLTLMVKRKDKERRLGVVWNPLLDDIEAPACEACLQLTKGAYLCDERLHLICQHCYECSSCHRKVCHACHTQACHKCNTPYAVR